MLQALLLRQSYKKNDYGPKKYNELARHQMIVKLEEDILVDLQICEIEGWDKKEYLLQLQELINGFKV